MRGLTGHDGNPTTHPITVTVGLRSDSWRGIIHGLASQACGHIRHPDAPTRRNLWIDRAHPVRRRPVQGLRAEEALGGLRLLEAEVWHQ